MEPFDYQNITRIFHSKAEKSLVNPQVLRKKPKKQSILFASSVEIPNFAVLNFEVMARVCQVTGKVPVTGHTVSHSNIKTKRRFLPNLQTKKFFLAEEDKWVTLKLSTEGIRTINKRGLLTVVKELRAKGVKI